MISNPKSKSSSGLSYKFSCKDCFLALSEIKYLHYGKMPPPAWKEQLVVYLCLTALLLEHSAGFVGQRRKQSSMDLKISVIQMRLGFF